MDNPYLSLLRILFPNTTKSKHLRENAAHLLYFLAQNQKLSVQEAKAICKHKKTYYKILRKLRSIGLITLTKESDGKFYLKLTLNTYKFFIRKHLIEEVEKWLKSGGNEGKEADTLR